MSQILNYTNEYPFTSFICFMWWKRSRPIINIIPLFYYICYYIPCCKTFVIFVN